MSGLIRNPTKGALERCKCTAEEWLALRDIGVEMMSRGVPRVRTPLGAYGNQRYTALNVRGIGWELTLMQWWAIWTESGHWDERGKGRGYAMCRRGDVGPYAVGNVFIGPGAENTSEAFKKSGLPIGVTRTSNPQTERYRAVCCIGGKQRHLGCFGTVTEARNAYLAALAVDLSLREAA